MSISFKGCKCRSYPRIFKIVVSYAWRLSGCHRAATHPQPPTESPRRGSLRHGEHVCGETPAQVPDTQRSPQLGRSAAVSEPKNERGGEKGAHLQILLGNLHSRIVTVTDNVGIGYFGSGGSQSLSIFVEHDVALSLNELKKRERLALASR